MSIIGGDVGAAKVSAIAPTAPPQPEGDWGSLTNPAITALLDHVAEELAREYVRLMENAAGVDEAQDRRPAGTDAEV